MTSLSAASVTADIQPGRLVIAGNMHMSIPPGGGASPNVVTDDNATSVVAHAIPNSVQATVTRVVDWMNGSFGGRPRRGYEIYLASRRANAIAHARPECDPGALVGLALVRNPARRRSYQ